MVDDILSMHATSLRLCGPSLAEGNWSRDQNVDNKYGRPYIRDQIIPMRIICDLKRHWLVQSQRSFQTAVDRTGFIVADWCLKNGLAF